MAVRPAQIPPKTPRPPARGPAILCFGAAHWDMIGRPAPGETLALGGDLPGRVRRRPGGVALNLALALAALGRPVILAAPIGRDAEGDQLADRLTAGGVALRRMHVHAPTGLYLAIEDGAGALVAAIAELPGCEGATAEHLEGILTAAAGNAAAWAMEANLPAGVLTALASAHSALPEGDRPLLAANPASPAKAARLAPLLGSLDLVVCNRAEAEALAGRPFHDAPDAAAALRSLGVREAAVTNGAHEAAASAPEGDAVLPPHRRRRRDRSRGRPLRRLSGRPPARPAASRRPRRRPRRRARENGAPFMTLLAWSDEAAAARAEGRPLVALESTIITHGLPWPRNLEAARMLEAEIREAGAVPATMAISESRIRVGLDDADLEALARSEGAAKLSRADLAATLAAGRPGSTTVAATMICARLAGIEVFATGGIGGVHRGADATWDVSADLHELARTPVTVVAAGAKAILDLPKTLEVLETLGVPVIGWRTDAFPAFWSRESGLPAPLRMDEAAQIARAHRLRADLGLAGGQLVANPIPEADEIPASELAPLIDQAVEEAEAQHIAAKAVTPFLLGRILNLTRGRSLEANLALARNNARLAAEIAKAM